MLVHPFGDPGWICLERSMSHIDEPVLAQQCSSHEGPTDAVEKVLEDLGADGVRVERRIGGAASGATPEPRCRWTTPRPRDRDGS